MTNGETPEFQDILVTGEPRLLTQDDKIVHLSLNSDARADVLEELKNRFITNEEIPVWFAQLPSTHKDYLYFLQITFDEVQQVETGELQKDDLLVQGLEDDRYEVWIKKDRPVDSESFLHSDHIRNEKAKKLIIIASALGAVGVAASVAYLAIRRRRK